MKKCKDCKLTKPYDMFSKKASNKDGYNVRCKSCHTIRYKKSSIELFVKKIYFTQINNSKIRKHPLPSYSLEELIEWVKTQPNWNILYSNYVNSNYQKKLAPSIDRLDSLKPYTLENIRLVTWQENQKQSANDKYTGKDLRTLKPIRALHLDGSLYKEYYSIKHAMRDIGTTSYHGIVSVANKKPIKCKGSYYIPKTYKNMLWEWV